MYGGPQSVFRFCECDARSLHNFLISLLLLSFIIQLCNQQQTENFLSTPQYFYVLEMSTFVPISYNYVPTAPRSKGTTARRKSTSKQLSILDKLQRNKLGCAAATDSNGGYKSGIQAETGTFTPAAAATTMTSLLSKRSYILYYKKRVSQ